VSIVLTALTRGNIVQVSDRLMTYVKGDGSVHYEDGHNKAILFEGHTLFGLIGAGQIEGLATDEWLEERLASGRDTESSLKAIEIGLKRSFPPGSSALAFIGGMWACDDPECTELSSRLIGVSNCTNPDGYEISVQSDFHFFGHGLPPDRSSQIAQAPGHLTPDEFTALEVQVEYLAENGDDPAAIAEALVAEAFNVAKREDTVGSELMVSSLPKKALQTMLREKRQMSFFASWPTPEAASFAIAHPNGDREFLSPRVVGARNWRARDFSFKKSGKALVMQGTYMRGTPPVSIPVFHVGAAALAHHGQRTSSPNERTGRNDPCWCGSDKKFKKCHGR
jgi:hypothetical protein